MNFLEAISRKSKNVFLIFLDRIYLANTFQEM